MGNSKKVEVRPKPCREKHLIISSSIFCDREMKRRESFILLYKVDRGKVG